MSMSIPNGATATPPPPPFLRPYPPLKSLTIFTYLIPIVSLVLLSACATTHVGYGPFAYTSDKDVALTKVKYDRVSSDGSSEHFSADAVGGTASTVEGARWQALEAAISKIPSVPIVPIP